MTGAHLSRAIYDFVSYLINIVVMLTYGRELVDGWRWGDGGVMRIISYGLI